MINFNEDFRKENYGPIDSGTYEVTIAKVEKKQTQTGREMLALSFVIRSDVEQPFKGRYIFENWFLDNNAAYANEGWFDTNKTYHVLHTQPGGKTDFETPDELLVYLPGLNMTVTVEKVFNEKTGNEDNNIKKNSYGVSKFPAKKVIQEPSLDESPVGSEENTGFPF